MANWGNRDETGRMSGTITYQVEDMEFVIDWKKARDMKQTAMHKDNIIVPNNCTTKELLKWTHKRMLKTAILDRAGWEIKYTISSKCVAWTIPLSELSVAKDLSETRTNY